MDQGYTSCNSKAEPPFQLDLNDVFTIKNHQMRLRLPKRTRAKLPIDEDQVPLKTKENLEEYLQSAISFLQTQEAVLERILGILEEISELESTIKADVIRNITKDQEEQSRKG